MNCSRCYRGHNFPKNLMHFYLFNFFFLFFNLNALFAAASMETHTKQKKWTTSTWSLFKQMVKSYVLFIIHFHLLFVVQVFHPLLLQIMDDSRCNNLHVTGDFCFLFFYFYFYISIPMKLASFVNYCNEEHHVFPWIYVHHLSIEFFSSYIYFWNSSVWNIRWHLTVLVYSKMKSAILFIIGFHLTQ